MLQIYFLYIPNVLSENIWYFSLHWRIWYRIVSYYTSIFAPTLEKTPHSPVIIAEDYTYASINKQIITMVNDLKKEVDAIVQTSENDPTVLGTNDQASAAASVAQPKMSFEPDKIYRFLDKNESGNYIYKALKICYIKSNRKEESQIKDKMKSLEVVGMLIPGRFANPSVAYKAGYELLDVYDDHMLKEKEASEYDAVIQEANTRFWAWKKFYDKTKKETDSEEEKLIDYIFFFVEYPNDDNGVKQFKTDYHQMNTCNCQTKIKNFVDDYLATQTNDILSSYQEKVLAGLLPKAAAYATTGKEVSKADIDKLFSGIVPALLNDSDILKYTDQTYNAICKCFGTTTNKCASSLKGAAVWKWVGSKLMDKNADKESVTTKIVSMFSKKDADLINEINNAKATTNQTKEQVVAMTLNSYYEKE